jgi:L-amino acid N-acyltransferase YncA
MIQIRDACPGDAEAIARLRNALLTTTTNEWNDEPRTAADVTRWLVLSDPTEHPTLVAVADGDGGDGDAVVGWAGYGDFRDSRRWPGYRFTVEHSIHVAETSWGKGVGRALMNELVDHARRAGKRVMVGGIDASNVGSIVFHERLGFREVGRLPGIGDKYGQRLDLVLMQRDLDPDG